MGEIKKRFRGVSEPVTYELETDLIDPPSITVRVRPISKVGLVDAVDFVAGEKEPHFSRYVLESVLEAVQDWDLTLDGERLPLNAENKRAYLWPLLGEKVKGDGQTLLGLVIFAYAADQSNFLKN